jgi:vacuolar-type H+-ATPase subunit I/STV1
MVKKFDWNTYLKNNTLPILLQAIGFLVVIANLYLASQLAPLAKCVDSLTFRVDAIEKRDAEVSPLLKEFIEVRQDIKYIKEDLNKLDTKVELLINKNL